MKDQNFKAALFQDLGSSPASIQASKCCDAYGLLPGHTVQQADARQAYTQTYLGGPHVTWARLPRNRWPDEWVKRKMVDPVVRQIRNLYGHPDAGGYWEQHCENHLLACDFVPIPNWKSCYVHRELKLLLVVYVDDFKLSGPAENIKEGWRLITKHIDMEPPTPTGKFLGCDHKPGEAKLIETGARVRTMEYDMQSFFESCVDLFQSLTHGKYPLKRAPTPFMTDPRMMISV